MHIPKLVLTGGPCGGKTKALTFLAKKLRSEGYHPLIVSEAATTLMSSGLTPFSDNGEGRRFQEGVIRHALEQETAHTRNLRGGAHPRPIILCDRGMMDSRAYVDEEMFRGLLRGVSIPHHAICRDGRYDAVIHLRSAACGAEAHYSTETNAHRYENIEVARTLDERTLGTWLGHQHLAIVGNTHGSFEGKLEATWRSACRLLGIPLLRETEKKFLVAPIDFQKLGIQHVTIDVTQYYLDIPDSGNRVSRIRSWGEDGFHTYTFTEKREVAVDEVEEIEEQISETAFYQYMKYQKSATIPLNKRRTCFVFRDQYFMYDEFLSGRPGLTMLEIELDTHDSPFELPDFVFVKEEVTHCRQYFNSTIAEVA